MYFMFSQAGNVDSPLHDWHTCSYLFVSCEDLVVLSFTRGKISSTFLSLVGLLCIEIVRRSYLRNRKHLSCFYLFVVEIYKYSNTNAAIWLAELLVNIHYQPLECSGSLHNSDVFSLIRCFYRKHVSRWEIDHHAALTKSQNVIMNWRAYATAAGFKQQFNPRTDVLICWIHSNYEIVFVIVIVL